MFQGYGELISIDPILLDKISFVDYFLQIISEADLNDLLFMIMSYLTVRLTHYRNLMITILTY